MLSSTTSVRESPTFTSAALSAISNSSILLHGLRRQDTDETCSDDQLARVDVGVVDVPLLEVERAASLGLLVPGGTIALGCREHFACHQRPVVLEVLLGMEPAGAGCLRATRLSARTEPGLTFLRSQHGVGVELRRRHRERGRGDDAPE